MKLSSFPARNAKVTMGSRLIPVIVLCLGPVAAFPQATPTASPASEPCVSFSLDFPGSAPEHYAITVLSSGNASYVSGPSPSAARASSRDPDSDSDDAEPVTVSLAAAPFRYEFHVSEATRSRIFDLAARARYFQSDLNYSKHNLANTGAKTLAYRDGRLSAHSTYNYTTNQPAQQLTALFQDMSATLEFGHRLSYLYQYQKLALEQEMKRMEEMAKSNNLAELQAIAPILKQIMDDRSVITVTRVRAQRLLALAEVGH